MRTWSVIIGTTLVAAHLLTGSASAIEAVRGKQYALSKRNGPWMIMVASFRDVPEDRREKGLSASDAALELVYELRKQGVPAYTHAQGAKIEHIDTVDRLGREDERIYAAQRDMVSVIAGNYPSITDETAQKTLQWIKSFRPEFLTKEESGAIYRETPGRRGPLAGAFLTINPLISPQEVRNEKATSESARELARWNNDSSFPLLSCKKPYTLQVATFTGRQATPFGTSRFAGKENQFDDELKKADSYGLNRAGEDAEQLTAALRSRGIEAYVHHDRYQSIVCVGGFDSPRDPAIVLRQREFSPKYKPSPSTDGSDKPGPDVYTPETLRIENPADPKGPPRHIWVFDLTPQLIQVPRLR